MLFSAAPVNSTPFKRNRFCCGRFPDTEKLFAVVELETPVPPVFSQVKLTIPGFSGRSRSKLRPLSGKFLICSWVTRPDTSDVVVLMTGASATTFTSCDTWPTLREKSSTTFWLTAMEMPDWIVAWKPCLVTFNS
jgi:hypothetical protein